jgi:pyruvate formate lyase activating enzyme
MKRRNFIKWGIGGACGAAALAAPRHEQLSKGLGGFLGNAYAFAIADNLSDVEARHYRKLEHMDVECALCPRKCVVGDRERGYCGVRENRSGRYVTLVHSRPCSINVDPIEKKPLFHFLPGTPIFSLATAGCNFNCKFCQNWDISQSRPEQTRNMVMPPEEIVSSARAQGCPCIAYTYSEPVIFYEYMYDIAKLGKSAGLRSVMITSGYINEKPLAELLPHMGAVKIDLKAFTEKYYADICRGRLKPVLDSLVKINKSGTWLEIVYLVVPTLNENEAEIKTMCGWILKELGPDVPVHLTRFHPMYLLKNLPATPVSTLEKLKAVADTAGLHYVYIGNVPGHDAENTYCHSCRKKIIGRYGFRILENQVRNGKCGYCGTKIPGVWS